MSTPATEPKFAVASRIHGLAAELNEAIEEARRLGMSIYINRRRTLGTAPADERAFRVEITETVKYDAPQEK